VNRYEILKFLHVAAAVIWLGSGFLVQVLVYRANQLRDRAFMLSLSGSAEWLARRVFIPSSFAVLLLGIVIVLDSVWEFTDLWILVGLAGSAASILVGFLLIEPEGKRIGSIIEREGPDSPAFEASLRKINTISRVELAILFIVVGDMVVKPTTDDTSTVVLLVLLVAASVGAGFWFLRGRPAPAGT
jgi:uncharacterized membrane protein